MAHGDRNIQHNPSPQSLVFQTFQGQPFCPPILGEGHTALHGSSALSFIMGLGEQKPTCLLQMVTWRKNTNNEEYLDITCVHRVCISITHRAWEHTTVYLHTHPDVIEWWGACPGCSHWTKGMWYSHDQRSPAFQEHLNGCHTRGHE
jgi:hypothetical protein